MLLGTLSSRTLQKQRRHDSATALTYWASRTGEKKKEWAGALTIAAHCPREDWSLIVTRYPSPTTPPARSHKNNVPPLRNTGSGFSFTADLQQQKGPFPLLRCGREEVATFPAPRIAWNRLAPEGVPSLFRDKGGGNKKGSYFCEERGVR